MAELWGREYTRRALLERTGSLSQVFGIDRYQLTEGPEKGVAAARVRTGSGLTFEVLLDRGMDIGLAEFRGKPLTWLSPTGRVAPSLAEPEGYGWLRTFGGGLLVTCGLTQVGTPVVDLGESLGLHGRATYLRAENVASAVTWEGDDAVLTLSGQLRQARVFGENLVLHRCISARLGEPVIHLHDIVENCGFEPMPHMILYHLNFGFPLVGPGTRLEIDAEETQPRDREAEAGLEEWNRLSEPRAGFQEQVFYHTVRPAGDGRAHLRVQGGPPAEDLRVSITYPVSQLPVLVQWKMMGQGTYVLGLEPANCHVEGRAAERARGTLVVLEPGESREYDLELRLEQ